MKFRAIIREQQYMKEFLNIILTLSKLTKDCVMNISNDTIHFIVNEESGNAAPLVWTEIQTSVLFDEYIMKGIDESHPNILLSLNPSNLVRALLMLRNAVSYCKIKLTNIQFACLTVQIETESGVQSDHCPRQFDHDVPVQIIPRNEWKAYSLPQIPSSEIVLTVPSNRVMRNLIDKLKNLSPSIIFFATSKGEMNLAVETELATITTRYTNLEIRQINPNQEEEQSGYIESSCVVDCKKAAIFFTALQVPTLEVSCGIALDRVMHFEVNVRRGVVIHCIIPAVCM